MAGLGLTVQSLRAAAVHAAVAVDPQENAEEPVAAGRVEVPQPYGLPPAVVDVRPSISEREGSGHRREAKSQQSQGQQQAGLAERLPHLGRRRQPAWAPLPGKGGSTAGGEAKVPTGGERARERRRG